MFLLMNRQMLFMVFRVNLLLFKDMWGFKKNDLDEKIYYMLDEYSYYYDYYYFTKQWKKNKRKGDND